MDLELDLRPLGPVELRALTYIEEYWLDRREFPAKILLERKIPEFNLDKALKNKTFLVALAQRGIEHRENGDLSAEQVAAIATITNFADRRSRNSKLTSLGITTTQWNGWLKNPAFKRLLHSVSSGSFEDELPYVQENLLRAVGRGDTNAIKFYMEVTGRFKAGSVTEQNLLKTISLLVESIQRHVRDPEVYGRIAADWDRILAGQSAPSRAPVVLEGTI